MIHFDVYRFQMQKEERRTNKEVEEKNEEREQKKMLQIRQTNAFFKGI